MKPNTDISGINNIDSRLKDSVINLFVSYNNLQVLIENKKNQNQIMEACKSTRALHGLALIEFNKYVNLPNPDAQTVSFVHKLIIDVGDRLYDNQQPQEQYGSNDTSNGDDIFSSAKQNDISTTSGSFNAIGDDITSEMSTIDQNFVNMETSEEPVSKGISIFSKDSMLTKKPAPRINFHKRADESNIEISDSDSDDDIIHNFVNDEINTAKRIKESFNVGNKKIETPSDIILSDISDTSKFNELLSDVENNVNLNHEIILILCHATYCSQSVDFMRKWEEFKRICKHKCFEFNEDEMKQLDISESITHVPVVFLYHPRTYAPFILRGNVSLDTIISFYKNSISKFN